MSMIAILLVWVVSFFSVVFAFPNDPMFTTHPQTTMASPALTAVFGTHLFLALLSFGAAALTVVLWFKKTDFMTKSRIPALVTEISWLIAFAVGLWIFIALNI